MAGADLYWQKEGPDAPAQVPKQTLEIGFEGPDHSKGMRVSLEPLLFTCLDRNRFAFGGPSDKAVPKTTRTPGVIMPVNWVVNGQSMRPGKWTQPETVLELGTQDGNCSIHFDPLLGSGGLGKDRELFLVETSFPAGC